MFEMLRRLEQPAPATAQELQGLQLGHHVPVVRRLVVGFVVVTPGGDVRQGLEVHRGKVVGQQLNFLVHMVGGHLVHQREVRHHDVHHADGDVHPSAPRVRLDTDLGSQRERLHRLPIGQSPEGPGGSQQVVQVRRAGAWQPDDHDWWQ